MIFESDLQRENFNAKWVISETSSYDGTPCHEWIAAKTGSPNKVYGYFWINNGMSRAHRVAWCNYHDETIPSDVHLNHKCNNKLCVNPLHLEITSNRENVLLGRVSLLKENKQSQYPGVTWSNHRNRWRARIYIDGKERLLGYFLDEKEAGEAYERARKSRKES